MFCLDILPEIILNMYTSKCNLMEIILRTYIASKGNLIETVLTTCITKVTYWNNSENIYRQDNVLN